MGTQHNNEQNNQVLIDKLRTLIYLESKKPISEMDTDFIDECVDFLMELEKKPKLTQEQFEAAKAKLFSLDEQKQKGFGNVNKRPRLKGLLVAACLLFLLLISGIITTAFDYDPIADLMYAIEDKLDSLKNGEAFVYKGLEFKKSKNYTDYDSVESFLKNEEYDILYPSKLPEGYDVVKISVIAAYEKDYSKSSEYKAVRFETNSSDMFIEANTNPNAPQQFLTLEDYTLKEINSIKCYLVKPSDNYQCEFIHNGITYLVVAHEYEQIIEIISNLKETK